MLIRFRLDKILEGYIVQFYCNTFPVFIVLTLPSWSDGVSVGIQKRPQEISSEVDYISTMANQTQITGTYLDVYLTNRFRYLIVGTFQFTWFKLNSSHSTLYGTNCCKLTINYLLLVNELYANLFIDLYVLSLSSYVILWHNFLKNIFSWPKSWFGIRNIHVRYRQKPTFFTTISIGF